MVAGSAAVLSRMARAGIGTLGPASGLAALAGVVQQHGAPPLVRTVYSFYITIVYTNTNLLVILWFE
jgi:hypothetical protein